MLLLLLCCRVFFFPSHNQTVRIVHTVAELSLEDIAAKYGVSVMEIRQWNRAIFPAGEAAILRQGSELIVYTRGDKSDRRCET